MVLRRRVVAAAVPGGVPPIGTFGGYQKSLPFVRRSRIIPRLPPCSTTSSPSARDPRRHRPAPPRPTRWRPCGIQYLARSGSWPKLLEGMARVPGDQKPVVGKAANQAKARHRRRLRRAQGRADRRAAESATSTPRCPARFDRPARSIPCCRRATAPSRFFAGSALPWPTGPTSRTRSTTSTRYNTPPDHPARNEQDTFYLKEDGLAPSPGLDGRTPGGRRLMRTQTSTVQIRAMLAQPPPVRIIAPGRCYRPRRDRRHARHVVLPDGGSRRR